MKTVRIGVQKLKETVKDNKKAHIADYQKACEGYRITVKEELEKILAANEDATIDEIATSIHAPRPEMHVDEYNRIIQMLEFTSDTHVELSQNEFDNYVLNNWAWSGHTAMLNQTYMSKLAN